MGGRGLIFWVWTIVSVPPQSLHYYQAPILPAVTAVFFILCKNVFCKVPLSEAVDQFQHFQLQTAICHLVFRWQKKKVYGQTMMKLLVMALYEWITVHPGFALRQPFVDKIRRLHFPTHFARVARLFLFSFLDTLGVEMTAVKFHRNIKWSHGLFLMSNTTVPTHLARASGLFLSWTRSVWRWQLLSHSCKMSRNCGVGHKKKTRIMLLQTKRLHFMFLCHFTAVISTPSVQT